MTADDISITGGPQHRQVSVSDAGRVLAAADVDTTGRPGVVRAVLRGQVQPLPGDAGARLVDAVVGLPEVADADRLDAAVPTAAADMVQRLRERTDDVSTRLAGGTVLVTAHPRSAPAPSVPSVPSVLPEPVEPADARADPDAA